MAVEGGEDGHAGDADADELFCGAGGNVSDGKPKCGGNQVKGETGHVLN